MDRLPELQSMCRDACGHGPTWGTISTFTWKDSKNHIKPARIANLQVWIWNWNLSNTKEQH